MEWKSIKLPPGSKLFQVHTFSFMFNGVNYSIEIDEYSNGTFTAHGEQSTDQSMVIDPVTAKSLKECIDGIVKKIQQRASKS